jgi:hypothetical protein
MIPRMGLKRRAFRMKIRTRKLTSCRKRVESISITASYLSWDFKKKAE